jgi:glucosamine-6-phosphate deaminase
LLKKQIIAYLLEHTSRSKEELPLARSLLKDLGFYIVSSRDFAWTAAGLVAGEINRVQKERGLVNAVFTGGRTMSTYISQGELKKGFLRELADPEYCISWATVNAFQLAEYHGLDVNSPYSYAHTLETDLFSQVFVTPEAKKNIRYIGSSPDPKAYIDELERLGGADIVILGVGSDGHIGLNPYGSHLDIREQGRLKKVILSEDNIRANKKDYPGIEGNPCASTMSLYDIVLSGNPQKKVFLLVLGKRKAKILRQALDESTTPVSMLLENADTTVIVDQEAVEDISPRLLNNNASVIGTNNGKNVLAALSAILGIFCLAVIFSSFTSIAYLGIFACLGAAVSVPGNKRMLLVDDDVSMTNSLKRLFHFCPGISEIECSSDGKYALEKMKEKGEFDIIITDFEMLMVDGMTFARTLRENGPKAYIILQSGRNPEENPEIRRALDEGVIDYYIRKGGSGDSAELFAALNCVTVALSDYALRSEFVRLILKKNEEDSCLQDNLVALCVAQSVLRSNPKLNAAIQDIFLIKTSEHKYHAIRGKAEGALPILEVKADAQDWVGAVEGAGIFIAVGVFSLLLAAAAAAGSWIKAQVRRFPLLDQEAALKENCFDKYLRDRGQAAAADKLIDMAVHTPFVLCQHLNNYPKKDIVLKAPAYRSDFIHEQLGQLYIQDARLKLLYEFKDPCRTKIYHVSEQGDIPLASVNNEHSWVGAETQSNELVSPEFLDLLKNLPEHDRKTLFERAREDNKDALPEDSLQFMFRAVTSFFNDALPNYLSWFNYFLIRGRNENRISQRQYEKLAKHQRVFSRYMLTRQKYFSIYENDIYAASTLNKAINVFISEQDSFLRAADYFIRATREIAPRYAAIADSVIYVRLMIAESFLELSKRKNELCEAHYERLSEECAGVDWPQMPSHDLSPMSNAWKWTQYFGEVLRLVTSLDNSQVYTSRQGMVFSVTFSSWIQHDLNGWMTVLAGGLEHNIVGKDKELILPKKTFVEAIGKLIVHLQQPVDTEGSFLVCSF